MSALSMRHNELGSITVGDVEIGQAQVSTPSLVHSVVDVRMVEGSVEAGVDPRLGQSHATSGGFRREFALKAIPLRDGAVHSQPR